MTKPGTADKVSFCHENDYFDMEVADVEGGPRDMAWHSGNDYVESLRQGVAITSETRRRQFNDLRA